MKKQFRTPFRKMAAALLPVALAACIANSSQAQDFVKTFRTHEDVKQYTILPLVNSDEYVMAGTLKNTYVHFMHTDANGNVMATVYYRDPSGGYQHHATNIVPYSDDVFIITALRRDLQITSSSRDVLELYFVKSNGTLVDHRIIQNTQIINGSNYTNIYPMHSVLNNDTLFVTGFVSNQPITDPAAPNFRGVNNKQIFVMRFNVNNMTVMTSKTYDFNYTPTSAAYADADMGVNMTLTSTGRLYVTGSANVIQPGPTTSSYNLVAGTLNLALNATTLAVVNSGSTSFVADYYPTQFTYGEYGVGMMEDQVNGGYNVITNSADYLKYGLLNIDPKTTSITHISSSFTPYATPAKSRVRVKDPEGAWSLEAMSSIDGPDHILLGGMQIAPLPNCTGNAPKPAPDDFNPFLADFSLTWDATTSTLDGTLNSWRTYLCHFGTGDPSLANSYFQLGGNFAYNAWNPVFATRRPVGSSFTDDISMTAPSWNPDYQSLNLKLIRADKHGDVNSCPDSYTNCNTAGLTPEQVNNTPSWGVSPNNVSVAMTSANYSVSASQVQAGWADWGAYEEIYCDASNNYTYFRKANILNTAAPVTATLTPNPAVDYINVSLQGVADGNTTIKVELTDITGKSAGVLYSGTADGLNSHAQLKLPALASGLYLVKIIAGTQILPVQKLVITQ